MSIEVTTGVALSSHSKLQEFEHFVATLLMKTETFEKTEFQYFYLILELNKFT